MLIYVISRTLIIHTMGRFLEYRKKLMSEGVNTQNTLVNDNPDPTPIGTYSTKYADRDNRIPKILGKTTKRLKNKKRGKADETLNYESIVDVEPIKTSMRRDNTDVEFQKIMTLRIDDLNEVMAIIRRELLSDLKVKQRRSKIDIDIDIESLRRFLSKRGGQKLHFGTFSKRGFLKKRYKLMVMGKYEGDKHIF